ncbi:unnamed protein product, partial [Hymenolepis diminuta]
HICAHVLARPYSSDSYRATFVFHSKQRTLSVTGSYPSCSPPLFLSTLPSLSLPPLPLASILIVASLNTFWSNQLLARSAHDCC